MENNNTKPCLITAILANRDIKQKVPYQTNN